MLHKGRWIYSGLKKMVDIVQNISTLREGVCILYQISLKFLPFMRYHICIINVKLLLIKSNHQWHALYDYMAMVMNLYFIHFMKC